MKLETWMQRFAFAALLSVLLLVFVGAIVRVTGSGMGCPDWPKCWGQLVPPWKIEQVDFEKLDLEKFRNKAERHGRAPETITTDSLRAEFNGKHTWIEFINRLCSLPVGFFSLATFIAAFWHPRKKMILLSFLCLFIVLLNAWMGARIVYSGLKPGTITTHMALAFLLLGLQTALVWNGAKEKAWGWDFDFIKAPKLLWIATLVTFISLLVEGVIGSQIRELTDLLQKQHLEIERSVWLPELQHRFIYLFHRSFSWVILLGTIVMAYGLGRGRWPRLFTLHFSIVVVMMLLGMVLSHLGIYAIVQVIHVGLAALMVVVMVAMLLAQTSKKLRLK